ncbi:MAG: DNA sulfur modification protein DndB [bacterium]
MTADVNITIKGILGQVFDGKYCVRGFAPAEDIYNLSKAEEYQREIDKKHVDEIKIFYNTKKECLFYPEIILGYSLDANNMQKLQQESSFKDAVIKATIPKSRLATLNFKDKLCLSIIDGNHRLNAYEKDKMPSVQIPFCIVFFPNTDEKNKKIIFNNINYKNKPLQLEENLKNIFNEAFSDDEIIKDFGEEYLKTKELIKFFESSFGINGLKNLYPKYREICFKLVILLIEIITDKKLLNNENIYKAASDILRIDRISKNLDSGMFKALTYYKLVDTNSSNKKFALFNEWAIKNNLFEISKINAIDLINVYNKIFESKSRQIFVSMPFAKDDSDNMFNAVKEIVKEISEEHNLEFPEPIRIDELDKSYSFSITDEIIKHIENSGYIIACLNYQRPNVYHEIGYAMGYISGKGLDKNLLLVMKTPENEEEKHKDEFRVHFNLNGYHRLEYRKIKEFKEKIKEKIKLHFGIESND